MNVASKHKPGLAILVGGGIAATLDINYAIFRAGSNFDVFRTLQSVASGWLGKDAYQHGLEGALIGLASHYAILFAAAAIYFIASQRFAALRTKPWICGALFGVFVYLFMNFIVLPASSVPFQMKYTPLRVLENLTVHMVLVGLPIALAIRKWTQPVLRA